MARVTTVLLGIALVLALAACAEPTADPELPTRPPASSETSPAPLTNGLPVDRQWSSPNGLTRAERSERLVLDSWRYSSIEEAASSLDFEPRLPSAEGLEPQYLLTSQSPDYAGDMPVYFYAVYPDGKLTIVEWAEDWPWASESGPGNVVINGTINGTAASITRFTNEQTGSAMEEFDLADLTWVDDGVTYHLAYDGTSGDAIKIAESMFE